MSASKTGVRACPRRKTAEIVYGASQPRGARSIASFRPLHAATISGSNVQASSSRASVVAAS